MHNLIVIGLFFLLTMGSIAVLLVGLGFYYWGKSKMDNSAQ